MIDPKLLSLLRCPTGGGALTIADESLTNRLNQMIEQGDGKVRDRMDQPVETVVDGGLVDENKQWLYPIRMGIPTLVADQAIAIE
ncbi:hypothetical protein LF1_14000 [Rubripirellula obstinata]|uniref:Trm112p-like protein n=1 Tax=Rubripirellula obstinata TaxID=406547 RepID=A0A5B1CE69_9BACT|nr:hypothetical protein [Rubripirellula obstinata]KAA1258876.1 hypothetical protein LF1_14000 [Rubripirellula obstinata]